jgi:uncharacterized protein (DUF1810 family)
MMGDWHELKKLVHLSGVRRFADMRIVYRKWDIRITPSGRNIWSPRPMSQRHEMGSFQELLGSVCSGDVILVFKGFKLKLVGVALNAQMPTSNDEYLSAADLGGNGCYIPVEPLYVAPAGQDDHDDLDRDEDLEDGKASESRKAERFDESLSTIEQIRKAQGSAFGLSLAHDELKSGRMKGDWVRWIFPSLAGAVVSGERGRYRLTSPGDAAQILRDPELGPGYAESVGLAWKQIVESGLTPAELMGSDANSDELRSSLEVFLEACDMLDADEKELPGIQEFIQRARQLLEYINPML